MLFLSDGKQYALKEYLKDKLSKLRNFQARREIQLHSNFCHPAILPMYAAWEDDHTVKSHPSIEPPFPIHEPLKL